MKRLHGVWCYRQLFNIKAKLMSTPAPKDDTKSRGKTSAPQMLPSKKKGLVLE